MSTPELSAALSQDIEIKQIDKELSLDILGRFNAGEFDSVEAVKAKAIPGIDNRRILDIKGSDSFTFDLSRAVSQLKSFGIDINLSEKGTVDGDSVTLSKEVLKEIGILLYPFTAYGILNGGSATSYADVKKNKSFSPEIFSICKESFETQAKECAGKAKGVTPGFINPDGTAGPSFIELKMRSVLIEALRYQTTAGSASKGLLPLFQMTSVYNDEAVAEVYKTYKSSPYLKDLSHAVGINILDVKTAVQPLISAFTHSEEGRPKQVFSKAGGKKDSSLPLPGGHGQNFMVLKEIYTELYKSGKRFAYLGNVDNNGYTINPVALAMLALTGKEAGFDFSFKTPVDVKGGILVVDQHDRLNCADIGPAISKEDVAKAESDGKAILFNCATGLFNLEYLVENIDSIIKNLPTRFSDQDKDAGRYSQAEQVTWEVIGMLDDILVFGIDKYDRFLAAKLLIENFMTSGLGLEDPNYPTDSDPAKDFKHLSEKLNSGLVDKLENTYFLKLLDNKWVPMNVDEIKARM